DPFVQDAALFLVDSAAKVTNPVDSGLFFADAILGELSLKDVDALPANHPDVSDTVLLALLASAVTDSAAHAATIHSLTLEAARLQPGEAPKPAIRRLNAVLDAMGPGPHTATDIRAAIKEQNELAARLASLGDDLVKIALDELGVVPASGKRLELSKLPRFRTGTKVSGKKVNEYFRRPGRVEARSEE